MIDVGLIGFGLGGRSFHAPVIRSVPGLRLAAILQRGGSDAARQYPDVRIVRSLDELLALPDIRLIVVATPNDSHYSLARQCLLAGRDVLVDKPFTTSLEDAAALVRLAKERSLIVTVYHNRRYDPDFAAIRKLVAAGTLGRIVRLEVNYDRYRPQLKPGAWREGRGPGAGIFFDIAPHLIDYALQLFDLPESLTADIRTERECATADDAFDVAFHYPRGLRVDLRSSILAAASRPHFVLHGTLGAFIKHTVDPLEHNLRFGLVQPGLPWSSEPEEHWGVLTFAAEDGNLTPRRVPPETCDYRDFYTNLRDALLGKTPLAVGPEYALDVMRLLELARHSNAEGRTISFSRTPSSALAL